MAAIDMHSTFRPYGASRILEALRSINISSLTGLGGGAFLLGG
jgi:hypothetical protein